MIVDVIYQIDEPSMRKYNAYEDLKSEDRQAHTRLHINAHDRCSRTLGVHNLSDENVYDGVWRRNLGGAAKICAWSTCNGRFRYRRPESVG